MLSEEWDGGFLEGWEQEMTETGLGGLHGSQLSDKGGCNHELTLKATSSPTPPGSPL